MCINTIVYTLPTGGEQYTLSEFEKYKENFEDKKLWGPPKERVALYVLLEMGLIRDHVEKRNLYNPVLPGNHWGSLACDTNSLYVPTS